MSTTNVSRRDFLKIGSAAAASLVVAVNFPESALGTAAGTSPFTPNAWVKIGSDGKVTILFTKSEMGQGVYTALPAIVAEELGVELSQVTVEQAISDKAKYGDQGTGGSSSVRDGYLPLRKAGAAAREMLVQTAAKRWNAKAEECQVEAGTVLHSASGRKAGFGELVADAGKLPVPAQPKLKDPKTFRIVGKPSPRLDTAAKCNGTAKYGIDVRLPGMLFASIVHSPVLGGKPGKVNAEKAKALPGVVNVLPLDFGVAVVGRSTYAAMQGCEALEVEWQDGAGAATQSAQVIEAYRPKLEGTATEALTRGDVKAAESGSSKKLEGVYELPYLAHAAMEPLNCTAHTTAKKCEIWVPTQVPNDAQEAVAKALGLDLKSVIVHTTFLGGGFGRRLQNDDSLEAALISRAAGAPVQVVWSRQEDIQHDYYRPNSLHRLSAALDASGTPIAFTNRMVVPSISEYLWPGSAKDGKDDGVKSELADMEYSFANMRLDYALTNSVAPQVPLGWWRSVYSSQNGFAQESFIDEIAHAAGKDPVALRLKLLEKAPRSRAVMQLAADKAGWGKPLPEGRARGAAFYASFGSRVAMVVEVSVNRDGFPSVHRVVCAIDCGQPINPAIVESQMQSSVAFGMSAAFYGRVTIEGGKVQESNFHDYELIRVGQMPNVECFVVPSSEAPGGVGEPGVPVVAPAIANALFALTGKRIRKLPFPARI